MQNGRVSDVLRESKEDLSAQISQKKVLFFFRMHPQRHPLAISPHPPQSCRNTKHIPSMEGGSPQWGAGYFGGGQSLVSGGADDNHMKLRVFDQRLGELEQRLVDVEKKDEGTWRGMGLQVDGLKESLFQQQKARDGVEERKAKELKLLESTLQVELSAEKQERREVEQLMMRQIEDKLNQLHSDVHAEGRRRETDTQQRQTELQRAIQTLGTKIDQTKAVSDERLTKISDVLKEEVARLTSILSLEKQMRETTEVTMFKMLEDMCAKLQKEIAIERKEREKAEETLLGVLEDACSRAEGGLIR